MATSVGLRDADNDPGDEDRAFKKYGRLNVTIKVVDGEDTGTVKLSAREPQVDRSVHATVTDDDGGMSGVKWQWYRGDPC